jgi:hypothetical protein
MFLELHSESLRLFTNLSVRITKDKFFQNPKTNEGMS